jgi:hypothetical protein
MSLTFSWDLQPVPNFKSPSGEPLYVLQHAVKKAVIRRDPLLAWYRQCRNGNPALPPSIFVLEKTYSPIGQASRSQAKKIADEEKSSALLVRNRRDVTTIPVALRSRSFF